jgi:hypothetical protein
VAGTRRIQALTDAYCFGHELRDITAALLDLDSRVDVAFLDHTKQRCGSPPSSLIGYIGRVTSDMGVFVQHIPYRQDSFFPGGKPAPLCRVAVRANSG